jgi:hypothetical protein
MNLIDLPNEILFHELFPKMELSDLLNLEVNHSMKNLVRFYIQEEIARKLGFRNLKNSFELIEHLRIYLNPNDIYFFLVENIKNKIFLITRYRNQLDEMQIQDIIYEIKEWFPMFKKDWENNFDRVHSQTIIRYQIYLFLLQNRPVMGLTFQNKDTRILEKVLPKWDIYLQNFLKIKGLSEGQIDEIRTEANTKIFQLWMY